METLYRTYEIEANSAKGMKVAEYDENEGTTSLVNGVDFGDDASSNEFCNALWPHGLDTEIMDDGIYIVAL